MWDLYSITWQLLSKLDKIFSNENQNYSLNQLLNLPFILELNSETDIFSIIKTYKHKNNIINTLYKNLDSLFVDLADEYDETVINKRPLTDEEYETFTVYSENIETDWFKRFIDNQNPLYIQGFLKRLTSFYNHIYNILNIFSCIFKTYYGFIEIEGNWGINKVVHLEDYEKYEFKKPLIEYVGLI